MELHLAIKNILKYQGVDFLLDPKMINALSDYNAFDRIPCARNILRILIQDGIIGQALKDRNASEKLSYKISVEYGWPKELIQYFFDSLRWGTGTSNKMPVYNETQNDFIQSIIPVNLPSQKPWSKMGNREKVSYLESIIEVDEKSFADHGLKVVTTSVSNILRTRNKLSFGLTSEIHGLKKNTHITHQLNFKYILYDLDGKIRDHMEIYYGGGIDRYLIDYAPLSFDVDSSMKFSKLLVLLWTF